MTTIYKNDYITIYSLKGVFGAYGDGFTISLSKTTAYRYKIALQNGYKLIIRRNKNNILVENVNKGSI